MELLTVVTSGRSDAGDAVTLVEFSVVGLSGVMAGLVGLSVVGAELIVVKRPLSESAVVFELSRDCSDDG